MLAPKLLSALMDDYLKYRALHQGSTPGSVEQYEAGRRFQAMLRLRTNDITAQCPPGRRLGTTGT
jgi:hypothetical protein